MALPKRKQSKARGRKSRTNWNCATPEVGVCTQCTQPKLPYRACPHCGYYKGRPIISTQAH